MVKLLKNSSGRAIIAGLFGLATAVSIGAVVFLWGNPVVKAANLEGCTRDYGADTGYNWDADGYHYKVYKFRTYADGNTANSALIDSGGPDCEGTPGTPSTSSLIKMDNLKYGGAKPIGAFLGVPGRGEWTEPQTSDVTPLRSPPIYRNSYGMQAGFVDDGGEVLIAKPSSSDWQIMWCINIQVIPAQAPNDPRCGPDISGDAYPQPAAGAGFLFTETNCPAAIGCSDGNNFNYYNFFNDDTPDYTAKIGKTDGYLDDFKLRMLTRQSNSGGFETSMFMTFQYPISAAECVSIIAPDAVGAGQTFSATMTFKNTGNATWNTSGVNRYVVGSSDPRDTTRWSPINPGGSPNRAALTDAVVNPGDSTTVTFSAQAAASGKFSWEILQEGAGWVGGKCSKDITVGGIPPLLHKIYAAEVIALSQQFVRDNQTFAASIKAYIWPDAGLRSDSFARTNRLWLAGIYGAQGTNGADTSSSDASKNADPNIMTSFNTKAEEKCPGAECLERVPLAYVPASDGKGVAGSANQDGSTTPNGNKWQSIRDESFGSWDPLLGGIASARTDSIGGVSGNYLNNVEISNIHVEAVGPQADAANSATQGGVTSTALQPDSTTQGANLAGGSQGPVQSGQKFNAWDNIRRPGASGGVTVTSTQASVDYGNSGGSPANFSDSPEALLQAFSSTIAPRVKDIATVNLTSLLQDGNDKDHPVAPYTKPTEPLSYTAGVSSIDNARLKWDEYVDWSQVDDKGHYYPTRANVPTGVNRGTEHNDGVTWNSASSGSPAIIGYHNGACTGGHIVNNPGPPPTSTFVCDSYQQIPDYSSCSSVSYISGWHYTSYNSLSYYGYHFDSRWGWVANGGVTPGTQSFVSDSNYAGTGMSYFGPNPTQNPTWATLAGQQSYWQDTSITAMNNAGSTQKPGHSAQWQRNTSDPLYTNRAIFSDGPTTPSFPLGWAYDFSSYTSCPSPGSGGGITGTFSATATYYPSPFQVNEGSPQGATYGTVQSFDGSADGKVDTGWSWTNNYSRVRYEQTYVGNYRNLGPRSSTGSGDTALYGVEGAPSLTKPARGLGIIGNPTIASSNADIFAAGGIASYFQNSSSSAYIFSNSQITPTNFNTPRSYLNYYFNNDPNRVNNTFPSGQDAVRYVFKTFDSDIVGKSVAYPVASGGSGQTVNLGGKIYATGGSYTMGATTFCGGSGTVVVQGDLTITGNLDYCGGAASRSTVPSVGFIVTGNVTLDPSVSIVKGAFFINGTFKTSSVTLNNSVPNNNRTTSDATLTLSGLVVANKFSLDRQPSGAANVSGPAEQFIYDGRVIVAPPPGFTDLYAAAAIWNEGAPR